MTLQVACAKHLTCFSLQNARTEKHCEDRYEERRHKPEQLTRTLPEEAAGAGSLCPASALVTSLETLHEVLVYLLYWDTNSERRQLFPKHSPGRTAENL